MRAIAHILILTEGVMIPIFFPLALVIFVALTLVVPAVRLHRATGHWGLALHQAANPFQRVLAVSIAVLSSGFSAWCVLYPLVGGPELGVWSAPRAVAITGGVLVFVGLSLIVVAQAQMGRSWRIGVDTAPTARLDAREPGGVDGDGMRMRLVAHCARSSSRRRASPRAPRRFLPKLRRHRWPLFSGDRPTAWT